MIRSQEDGVTVADRSELEQAIARVGQDPVLRRTVIEALVDWESRNFVEGEDLRSYVTGPIVDALHGGVAEIETTLDSGLTFVVPYDSRIARDVAMGAETASHVWEPQTTRLLTLLAPECRTVAIGGAFIGDHAVPIAANSPDGTVYCFEIQPHYAEALRRNVARNELSNVEVIQCGLWSTTARLSLVGTDVVASPTAAVTDDSFPAVTLDDFLQERGNPAVDLIVLDIEGGEEQALRGAARQLGRPPGEAPVLVFEVHRHFMDWSEGLRATPVVRFLEDLGYTVFGIRDYQATIELGDAPIEVVELDGMYLDGPPHGFNVLAVKDLSAIERWGLVVRRDVAPKLLRHRSSPLHRPGVAG
jgi:FkbM family methyltransferase